MKRRIEFKPGEEGYNTLVDISTIIPHTEYAMYEYNQKNNIIECNNKKFIYDGEGNIFSIIEQNADFEDIATFETKFEYFDNQIRVTVIRIGSESIYSLQGIAYTNDGENIIRNDLKEERKIIQSFLIDKGDEIKYIPKEIRFHLSENNNNSNNRYNEDSKELILEKSENKIITKNEYYTEFGNTVCENKEYSKHFDSGLFLLSKIFFDLKYKDGAEYYSTYNENKEIIVDENSTNFDYTAHRFEEMKNLGIEYYNYDLNGNINYIENNEYIIIFTLEFVNKEKTERQIIINKRKKTFDYGYSLKELVY